MHSLRRLPTVLLTCALAAALTFTLAACSGPAAEVAEPGVADPAGAPVLAGSAWTYQGAAGPEAWAALSAAYAACGEGLEQSPVALRSESADEAELPPLEFDYGPAALEVEDTGYGYKAAPSDAHTLRVGDDTYRLLQFHPHTPSEHTIDGELYPMVLHFVHQNDDGELAVVGVMVEEGAESSAYEPFVQAASEGEDAASVGSLEALLPRGLTYFTYEGSLTTPPCTEGVRWIVLREPVALSEAQIDVFAEAGETNRPLQPLGDRTIRISD